MAIARIVNNLGIGRVEGTFDNDTTSAKDFKASDLDSGLNSCEIVGNNKVGMGTDGHALFGAVIGVSEEVDANAIPEEVVVALYGIELFEGVATQPGYGDKVQVNGAGKVKQDATLDTQLVNLKSRGIVTNVYSTSKTEILL